MICLLKVIKTFRLMALTYIQHGELAEKELREEENEDSEERYDEQ